MAPDLDMDLAAVYAMLARPQTCIFLLHFLSSCSFLAQVNSNNQSHCTYSCVAGPGLGPTEDTKASRLWPCQCDEAHRKAMRGNGRGTFSGARLFSLVVKDSVSLLISEAYHRKGGVPCPFWVPQRQHQDVG